MSSMNDTVNIKTSSTNVFDDENKQEFIDSELAKIIGADTSTTQKNSYWEN